MKLPGVNTKNIAALLNKGESLDHLLTLNQVSCTFNKYNCKISVQLCQLELILLVRLPCYALSNRNSSFGNGLHNS